jgi:xylan 1,4-beta-xylosidase
MVPKDILNSLKMNKLLFVLIAFSLFIKVQGQGKEKAGMPERVIEVHFTQERGKMKTVFNECVGAGRANEGLRADWQQQLKQVKEELGFRYIRMHGLLHDDMGVYSEDKNGNPVYNWQYIDVLYDFLLSVNVKPFVELSFMPQALASGEKTVFWWKANVTPPKSYEKWAGLIEALIRHFTARYGKDEVKTWYLEVWNEPNHPAFWSSDMNEYFKLYDCTAKAVKSVCSEYRVGGPATAGNGWVSEIIEHCTANKIPLDFISTHAYAVDQGFFDETGETGTVLSPNPRSIIQDVSGSKKRIDESVRPDLELHYTEWSASYTPTDPIHDSYHEAAFILDKLKGTESMATSMSYWVFTDIFEENGPRYEPFHGGFGLMNYQSIKKPAYYAYQFLNQLGQIELTNNDPSSWVCKNERGDVQVLLWDFTNTHPGKSVINQVYYKRDLPAKSKGKVLFTMNDLPAGKYLFEVYQTGYRVNDAYSGYLDLGSPQQLSVSQTNTIKRLNDGSPVERQVVTIGAEKKFEHKLSIRENDVFMLKLSKL